MRPIGSNTESTPTLGVTRLPEGTAFACYAPNADRAEVRVFKGNEELIFPLNSVADGFWQTTVVKDFTGYAYLFRIWTPEPKELVDPYAFQLVTPTGSGIITDLKPPADDGFQAPSPTDLTVMEVHARDLVGWTSIPKNQSVFSQLKSFFSQSNPIEDLGVNAVEFMPLTEFDASSPNMYAWGYMPAHYFALSHTYGTPQEFQTLVQTLHARGLAVILDVVYNHAGKMNDLLRWDAKAYFRHDTDGKRTNCSGCDNDSCTEHPFIQRLIIDSLLHFLKFYRVDGFRFDLAELLNVDVLRKIEARVRAYKKDVILIAEPWSFRGHIAHQLKHTTWSCWNDRFRESIYHYIEGNGSAGELAYVMGGCIPDPFENAFQSINYTESHDDYTWADRIDGDAETVRRKTHIMFVILMLSSGIPMIAEGQDFLRSKHHVRNTYNRGGLNLLDWELLKKHELTHRYVKNLLKLRASDLGKLFKVGQPMQTYKHLFRADKGSAVGILFNADGSKGKQQVLFFVNPHSFEVNFDLNNLDAQNFHQIADTDRFFTDKTRLLSKSFALEPMSCALFIKEM
jgi:pullulanase/glycogen debranching enzyme